MKRSLVLVLGALVAIAAGYGLYTLGMQQGMRMAGPSGASVAGAEPALNGEDATRRHIAAGLKAGDIDPASGRRILYYHDPMVPANRFDRPGKSPFMDMMLVPVFEGAGADTGGVAISPRTQQNLGVRTATVTEGPLALEVSAVGAIAWNERDQVVVQARAPGFVERLYVRATLDRVAAGQPLADLHVPEWIAAQEEFLAVKRMTGPDTASLVDAARARMRQIGMSEALVAEVESSGRPRARITVSAPIAGALVEIGAREGMAVMAGATLFRVNGLGTVWANAEVPETQAALVRPGAAVVATSPAVPGARFSGRVQTILPEVDAATRTLKARLELANPGGRLVPGMFVQMQFAQAESAKRLLVPSEAVIQTGRRTVALVAGDDGRFRAKDIEIGVESNGMSEVKRGLAAGERVVVSGQFLIDSEASLKGVEARLNASESAAVAPAKASAKRHTTEAKVEHVAADALTLSHPPIPSLQWGSMTMEFKPPAAGAPGGLKPGDRVAIEFYMTDDGTAQLTAITPIAPTATTAPAAPHGAHK